MLCGTFLFPASAVVLLFKLLPAGLSCVDSICARLCGSAMLHHLCACLLITECCLQALRNDNIKVVLINPAAVRTGGCLPSVRVSSCWVCALIADTNNGASLCADMTAGRGFIPERMLHPEDIAESAMLALHTSENACPQEITMRLGQSAMQ